MMAAASGHEGRARIYLDLDGDLNNSIRSSPTRFVWGPAKDRVIAPNSRVLEAALGIYLHREKRKRNTVHHTGEGNEGDTWIHRHMWLPTRG